MYIVQSRMEVVYGHYADLVRAYEEVDRLCEKKGIRTGRMLCPSFGKTNELVYSVEYDSLEQMHADQEAFQSDPEIMKAFRAGAAYVVQGSATNELLEPVPHLA